MQKNKCRKAFLQFEDNTYVHVFANCSCI